MIRGKAIYMVFFISSKDGQLCCLRDRLLQTANLHIPWSLGDWLQQVSGLFPLPLHRLATVGKTGISGPLSEVTSDMTFRSYTCVSYWVQGRSYTTERIASSLSPSVPPCKHETATEPQDGFSLNSLLENFRTKRRGSSIFFLIVHV
jgi:hypothetical protein